MELYRALDNLVVLRWHTERCRCYGAFTGVSRIEESELSRHGIITTASYFNHACGEGASRLDQGQ